jgi:NADH:ubiquinone oxidoreductase subunit
MTFLRSIFIWWRGATLGTLFTTWFSGEAVGTDQFGNRYYQSKRGRRWVIYNGTVEASRVPPEWHGWLHHTFKNPPTETPLPAAKPWELEHRVNMSGTDGAYHPQGSLAATGVRPPATGDYQAWKPE